VLKKSLEAGPALNAAAHMTACLVDRADETTRAQMTFLDYQDRDAERPTARSSANSVRIRWSQAVAGAFRDAWTAASTCRRVVGKIGTELSAAEISSSISVQPSTTPSTPARTRRVMTSR